MCVCASYSECCPAAEPCWRAVPCQRPVKPHLSILHNVRRSVAACKYQQQPPPPNISHGPWRTVAAIHNRQLHQGPESLRCLLNQLPVSAGGSSGCHPCTAKTAGDTRQQGIQRCVQLRRRGFGARLHLRLEGIPIKIYSQALAQSEQVRVQRITEGNRCGFEGTCPLLACSHAHNIPPAPQPCARPRPHLLRNARYRGRVQCAMTAGRAVCAGGWRPAGVELSCGGSLKIL